MKALRSPTLVTRLALLAMASSSACLAQHETNRTSFPPTALPYSATPAFSDNAKREPSAATNPLLSRPTAEIVQLTQSGIDENVVLAFLENSGQFDLAAEDIILLNDLGVSSHIINAMLAHDRKVASRQERSVAASELESSSRAFAKAAGEIPPQSVTAALPIAREPALATTVTNKNLSGEATTTTAQPVPDAKPISLSTPSTLNSEFVDPASTDRLQPAAVKKKVLYPVRAPYPVELTAPIVFLEPPTF